MSGPVKWIIVLVAFEDDEFEPQVLKERLEPQEDEFIAAFLRGGELLAVISVLSAQAGAWGVRVHDVRATRRALDVLGAWQSGRRGQHT